MLQTRLSPWPSHWGRKRRSNCTIAMAGVAMAFFLGLVEWPLALLPEPIGPNAPFFVAGMRITVFLTLISGCAGVILGILAALGKTAANRFIRSTSGTYIAVIRGTPLLVQVLFTYFALPTLLPGLELGDFASACVALSLNAGAYNAEAIRAGLLAVATGQLEAARSLGMGRWHTFIDVVFPQAFKIALPSLVNNFVGLLKDSSLAYAIGVVELTNVGNRIQASSFQPLPILATTASVYLLLTIMMTWISGAVEARFDVEGRRK